MLRKHTAVLVLVLAGFLSTCAKWRAPDGGKPDARFAQTREAAGAFPSSEEFGRVVTKLRGSAPEDPALPGAMESALEILDRVAIASLTSTGNAKDLLPNANRRLAAYVTREPAVGEGYRLCQIGEKPDVYVLAANFGSSGPSAFVVYAGLGPQGPFRVVGRINRFSQRDYFDDYLELVGINSHDAVFLTVTGRTDELQSGWFAAWRFDGQRVVEMWSSELLSHSSYEAIPGGVVITYCANFDEHNPAACRKKVREAHLWDGTSWRQTRREEAPAPQR